MSEIKPLTLVSGCNLGVLISEHPENSKQREGFLDLLNSNLIKLN